MPKCLECSKVFQSMLPVRGATNSASSGSISGRISIHAPRAGSDRRGCQQWAWHPHFNPCSPCGERRPSVSLSTGVKLFQSMLPVRGATPDFRAPGFRAGISIHAPRAGSDRRVWSVLATPWTFQSMLPVRGATHGLQSSTATDNISIHAPRAGSDVFPRFPACVERTFQSTLPVRGATVFGK